MSIDLVARVLKANIRPASHKLAAIQLAEGTNQHTGVVWRSMASIAACLSVTQRQAKRVMRELQKDGVVLVLANRTGGAPGTVPVYKLNSARLIELTPTSPSTGDTNVILIGVIKGHSRHGGCHSVSATGDAGVTQTGSCTPLQPKDAHTHEHAREGLSQVRMQGPNSRHQDEMSGADSTVDGSVARQKLREMAEQLRMANDPGKPIRRPTYG